MPQAFALGLTVGVIIGLGVASTVMLIAGAF